MTNFILNGQKGSYDFHHNEEYKKCPYCGSVNHLGGFHMGKWDKKYSCGSIIRANWSNDGYTISFEKECDVEESLYNGTRVVGRVLV